VSTPLPGAAPSPKIAAANRRTDIPTAVSWLRTSDAPENDAGTGDAGFDPESGSDPRMAAAAAREAVLAAARVPVAGAGHPLLGRAALTGEAESEAGMGLRDWEVLTGGFSEEEKRQFILTNYRRRRCLAATRILWERASMKKMGASEDISSPLARLFGQCTTMGGHPA
jgi:hypothetical protein